MIEYFDEYSKAIISEMK